MELAPPNFSHARRHLEIFEPWQKDHGDAMFCRDLEDWMNEGISVFKILFAVFVRVRGTCYVQGRDADGVGESIEHCKSMMAGWLAKAKNASTAVAVSLNKFGTLEGHEEFQETIEVAEEAMRYLENPFSTTSPAIKAWRVTDEEVEQLNRAAAAKPGEAGTWVRKPSVISEGSASLIQ